MDEMPSTLTNTSPDPPSRRRARQVCPHCGHTLYRVHRRRLDRLASLIVPLHRYRCNECGWSGLHISARGRPPRAALIRNMTRLALIVAGLVLSVVAAVLISMASFFVR